MIKVMNTFSSSSSHSSAKKRSSYTELSNHIFYWSIEDILNADLYQNQVQTIPESFQSQEHCFESYIFPLLEEVRSELCSSMEMIQSAPSAEIVDCTSFIRYRKTLYNVTVDHWTNRYSTGQDGYKTLPGDIFLITNVKPESISDLLKLGSSCSTFAFVLTRAKDDDFKYEDDGISTSFTFEASKHIEFDNDMRKPLYVIFLINITTNKRIWDALHLARDAEIIRKVLAKNSTVEDTCDLCSMKDNGALKETLTRVFSSELNESQRNIICSCLRKSECGHLSFVELLWGPPGTGKTRTVNTLLAALLQNKGLRILACAPSNVAVNEMALGVYKMVQHSFRGGLGMDGVFCSFGNILLVGNKKHLNNDCDLGHIHMDNRVGRLMECLGNQGWAHCFRSMTDLLENCVSEYQIYKENESISGSELRVKSFAEYARDRFVAVATPLRRCIVNLCVHTPKGFLLESNYRQLELLYELLRCLEPLLLKDMHQCSFISKKNELLSILSKLDSSLRKLRFPSPVNQHSIKEFCLKNASLILCTVSSSFKLFSVEMEPINLLVIDEAAQLKECETFIPLQLPGINHVILIGDERQLRSTVHSAVSEEAGFDRSMFERLSSLGFTKHLLGIQYRMHPSIAYFPNSRFYGNQILNGPNVIQRDYEKHYLPGEMFGPYSFINVSHGREELDDAGRSRRNMVEVAAVTTILQNLKKAWTGSCEKLNIGVISPYTAQVSAIQDKIGNKYDNVINFCVKVKSVDGYQGAEEDIIIISTVRSNRRGSVGFISNIQRTNVALTRARHALWILGDRRTLVNSGSIWEQLIRDAESRKCCFDADEDSDLAKSIVDVKKELGQVDDLLNADSILFKNCRWKVLFSEDFKKSFAYMRSSQTKKSVVNLLVKLSSGWRPKQDVDIKCGSSSHMLKKFKVENLYVICAVDLVKDESTYLQVLKIWDILPLDKMSKLVNRLNEIFTKYTDDYVRHCQEICFEGRLEVPKSWVRHEDIIKFRSATPDVPDPSGTCIIENSKVSESLLLMKFYPLSYVGHLLLDREGRELDLPYDLTDEEGDIIHYNKSTFILGRSGTGKTTVLTMKLCRREQLHEIATEAIFGVNTNLSRNVTETDDIGEELEIGENRNKTILKQLFVTVSSKLCLSVKQRVSNLKRFVLGEPYSAKDDMHAVDYLDYDTHLNNIPDSFVDVPATSYPLVITYNKFLMMLDGTVGVSYFQRFPEARKLSRGERGSSKSVAFRRLTRNIEVDYEKFVSSYWPHFNFHLTKTLEPSRAFTEIMTHIKGNLRAEESSDGKLRRDDYVLLSDNRASTLSNHEREMVYDIFENYEKMKRKRGEFDMADLVIDLHRRLKLGRYEGEELDFVYIDEVQDLTMRQIALFKHVCKNVEEGFVFCGDTAQTIARGVDFRFEDIRHLFYNEFILGGARNDGLKEKGRISPIFHLTKNFRTHIGVLKLAQSVIELIYWFFPQSIDNLSPESSLIYGEAPLWLESRYSNENPIKTIFGNCGYLDQNVVSFGAQQVVLVRDEALKEGIAAVVGKHALVLTIAECKGLEFQDVLLYNFFGSSPLKIRWRIIYEYMRDHGLLNNATSIASLPCFNQAKHNLLCSELKHLYVAVTRTRQRLWICEDVDEISRPILDYWKSMHLVQVTELDNSVVRSMQVASSPDEWRSRGFELLGEKNYAQAATCFGKANDTYWQNYANDAGLKTAADRGKACR